jgi:hypothetical protein
MARSGPATDLPGGRSSPSAALPGVDLYWLPFGAGGHSVRLNGIAYEAVVARRERRARCDLYAPHSRSESLHGRLVIEMTLFALASAARVCASPRVRARPSASSRPTGPYQIARFVPGHEVVVCAMQYAVTVEPDAAGEDERAVRTVIEARDKDDALDQAEPAYRRLYPRVGRLGLQVVRVRPRL